MKTIELFIRIVTRGAVEETQSRESCIPVS